MVRLRNFIRLIVISIKHYIYTKLYGMHIDKSARISFGAKIDKTNPCGVHIGEESYIASGAIVFTHDFSRGGKKHIHRQTMLHRSKCNNYVWCHDRRRSNRRSGCDCHKRCAVQLHSCR